MCGRRPAFWFNLKASSGALSIGVSSSHMNLAHVVGAMIVVDRCGDGMEGKEPCTVPTMPTHLQLQRRSRIDNQ